MGQKWLNIQTKREEIPIVGSTKGNLLFTCEADNIPALEEDTVRIEPLLKWLDAQALPVVIVAHSFGSTFRYDSRIYNITLCPLRAWIGTVKRVKYSAGVSIY